MLWFYLALGTAIFWGAGYALSEKFLHNGVSVTFFLGCLTAVSAPLYLVLSARNGTIKSSLEALFNTPDMQIRMAFIACILAYVIGNLLISHAIQIKNATYANLIEITYPLFTILFSYLLYRNFYLTWSAALGALLIMAGVFLILLRGHT